MPIREAFTNELETSDDNPKSEIREIMLSIVTADSRGAGTDAKVYLQIGERRFLLDNSRGAEVTPGGNSSGSTNKVTTHQSFELSLNIGGITLSTAQDKHLSAYSMSELPVGAVEQALGKIKHDEFEKGQTDIFFLKGKDGALGMTLEALRGASLKLFHDKAGLASDWHVWQVELMLSYTEKDAYQFYKKWHAVGWLKDSAPEVLLQGTQS